MASLSQVSLQEIRMQNSPLLKEQLDLLGGGPGSSNDDRAASSWERPRDRVCNHIALALLGFVLLSSICCIIGGSALLNSIADLPFYRCEILFGVGAAAVVVGCVATPIVIAVGYRLFKTQELALYGACLFPEEQSSCVKVGRLLLTGTVPLLAGLLALGLSIGSIALFTLSTTVPSLTEDYKSVPGIAGEIRISRDASGLTHIFANSRADAYFGQGFAEAQDRLWQLEFNRLAARGRLAEFVGDAGLKFDKQTRTLNIVEAGLSMCRNISVEHSALFQAFVNGVNYYLSNVNERPPEFLFMSKRLLFFHDPEPFTIEDVCLSARLLQWQLSFNIDVEIERFKMFWLTDRSYDEVEEMYVNMTNISNTIFTAAQLNLTEEDAVMARAREAGDSDVERHLYATYMTNLRTTMTSQKQQQQQIREEQLSSTSSSGYTGVFSGLADMDFLKWKARHASNAWAARAAGPNTKACGASDPHLNINIPSVWYYSHLTYPNPADNTSFDVSGVSMLGIPGCHIGKTSHVAWGITMSLTDLEDLFLLVPDPADPDNRYLVNGTSYAYTLRTEVIRVHGAKDVSLVVQDSMYGPVATEALKLPDGLKFAVYAKPLQPDDTSIAGILNLGDPEIVRTVRDLRDFGFGQFQSPGFSIPMQDEQGNIGYTMTGWHWVRAVGHTGKYPTLGNGSFDPQQAIPFHELPTIVINASVATVDNEPMMMSSANQKIYPDGYRYTLGYDYVYPWRGARIQERLLEGSGISGGGTDELSSFAFHQSVQRDIHSNVWTEMRAVMQANADFTSHLSTASASWFADMQNTWDGLSSKGSGYPSLFFLWMRSMSTVPKDVIHALDLKGYWDPSNRYPYQLLANPTPRMTRQCGDATSPTGGSCGVFAAQAFNALTAQYPTEPSAPRWGTDLSQLTATNLMMHGTIMECMFDRSIPKDGDYSTIDVSAFQSTMEGDMSPNAASSMRQLYDWSTPTNVSFIFPGGDSGNPYSARYQNLLTAFGDDEYVVVQVEGRLPVGDEVMGGQSLTP